MTLTSGSKSQYLGELRSVDGIGRTTESISWKFEQLIGLVMRQICVVFQGDIPNGLDPMLI
jgi:hypothetical protein